MKFRGKTIRKNKNCNTWYTRFRFEDKQYYISGRTQFECMAKLKQALKRLENGEEEQVKTITFIEWYNKWLELYKIGKVKQTTINDYHSSIKNIPEIIKNKDITTLTTTEIISMLNKIEAERQRQKVYELLKTLFKKAIDNDIITKDIISRIDKPKHERENGKPLTFEQEQKLIDICKINKYGDLILVALYQGFRKGEILGITINDIDFDKKTISINKAINHKNKFDTTKNSHSERTVPMFDKTIQILNKFKNVKGRIFKISYNRTDEIIKELNKEVGFYFTLKYLRSTFITRCKEQNIPEFIIQTWVGHRIGSKITSTVYTKSNKDIDYKYINILNNSKFYSNSTHE